jgi:hypothetical protein
MMPRTRLTSFPTIAFGPYFASLFYTSAFALLSPLSDCTGRYGQHLADGQLFEVCGGL